MPGMGRHQQSREGLIRSMGSGRYITSDERGAGCSVDVDVRTASFAFLGLDTSSAFSVFSSPVRDGRVGPVVISFLPPVPRRPVEEMGDSVDDAGRVNRLLLVFFHS